VRHRKKREGGRWRFQSVKRDAERQEKEKGDTRSPGNEYGTLSVGGEGGEEKK